MHTYKFVTKYGEHSFGHKNTPLLFSELKLKPSRYVLYENFNVLFVKCMKNL